MEPQIRPKPVRYYEIDLLRFLAALSVILFHFIYRGFYADNLSPVEYSSLGKIFKYGYLGVELFFIISGYVVLMSAHNKTLKNFFISRVIRLYPAYWVACFFTFIIVRLFGPHIHEKGWSLIMDAPVSGLLANLTMLQSFFGVNHLDGVFWTLTIELIFYFIISLLIAFGWFNHLLSVLTVWLIYCIMAGPIISGSPFAFMFFPRYAPFFIAGRTFYLIQNNYTKNWKLYLLLTISYLLAIRSIRANIEETSNYFHQSFSVIVAGTVITAFFIIFILITHRYIQIRQAAWIGQLGALTYPAYLLHHNVGYVVLQRFGNSINKYILLEGMLITVLMLAYLLHVQIERRYSITFGQWLRKLLARA